MFKKVIGDVRHGYVESALTSEFIVYGDREKTLEAIRAAGKRVQNPSPEENIVVPEFVPICTIHGLGIVAAKYI